MKITRSAEQTDIPGPSGWFTGSVRIRTLFQAEEPARVGGANVTFEPGARTAWHTHPLGQTLLVISGTGRAQRAGDAVQEISTGDIIWFAPGERHWHGAGPSSSMTHTAIQEKLDGRAAEWLEHVTDDEYNG